MFLEVGGIKASTVINTVRERVSGSKPGCRKRWCWTPRRCRSWCRQRRLEPRRCRCRQTRSRCTSSQRLGWFLPTTEIRSNEWLKTKEELLNYLRSNFRTWSFWATFATWAPFDCSRKFRGKQRIRRRWLQSSPATDFNEMISNSRREKSPMRLFSSSHSATNSKFLLKCGLVRKQTVFKNERSQNKWVLKSAWPENNPIDPQEDWAWFVALDLS